LGEWLNARGHCFLSAWLTDTMTQQQLGLVTERAYRPNYWLQAIGLLGRSVRDNVRQLPAEHLQVVGATESST